jgi:hypothetical protein
MPRPAGPVGPAQVVAAAVADARTLPPEVAKTTRYLDARTLLGDEAAANYGVISYHLNGLSREVKIVAPRRVTPYVWAIDLTDYHYPSTVFGALREVNFYYAVPVLDPATGQKDFIPNPLLTGLAELTTLTGSLTPVVRADQFLVLTGAQAGRAGFGYYDVLEFTKLADVEKLAALDRKTAERLYRESGSIIPASRVALNNRQLFRYATLVGCWWESRDADREDGRSNATANLLNDFKIAAREIVFTLPNGLPGYYACDADGKQVDTVPDTVATDNGSLNNDKRIHPCYSCVGCHSDAGLKPFDDWARRLYSRDTGLKFGRLAVDRESERRLESVYLGPVEKLYARDKADFAEKVLEASGLKPAELADEYRRVWSKYLDAPVTPRQAALELGVTVEDMRARFTLYAASKGAAGIDPVLASLAAENGLPVRRAYWEERFATALLILQGANP